MAASHEQTVEVAASPPEAEAAVFQAFLAAGATHVHGGGGTMYGSVAASMWSWGENLTAIIGFGPRGAVATVRSECAVPTQLVDWGRNRKNVERVIDALRTVGLVV